MPADKAEEIAAHDIVTRMIRHKLKFGDQQDNQNWMRLEQELTNSEAAARQCTQLHIDIWQWQNEEED